MGIYLAKGNRKSGDMIDLILKLLVITAIFFIPLAGWLYEDHKIEQHINKRR